MESWDRFADQLAARRRVIGYARRGFTAAALEPAEDMRVHAEDALSILDRAGRDAPMWSGGAAGAGGARPRGRAPRRLSVAAAD
jgi:hypothetical protein